MSEHDILGDAIERLEWDERKQEETPAKKWHQVTRRAALTGGAAGIAALALEACGSFEQGKRQQQRRVLDLWVQQEPALRPCQPRDHQHLLHADPERRGRRVQAARLLVHVDGFVDEQCRRDGQRDQQRHNGQGRRHREFPDLPRRPSISPSHRRSPRASRSSPITLTNRRQDGWPTSARTSFSPARRWAPTSRRSSRPARSRCSSQRRARPTSSPGSTVRWTRSRAIRRSSRRWSRPGRRSPAELTVINSWATGHSSAKGMFAVDAGFNAGLRADDPEAGP